MLATGELGYLCLDARSAVTDEAGAAAHRVAWVALLVLLALALGGAVLAVVDLAPGGRDRDRGRGRRRGDRGRRAARGSGARGSAGSGVESGGLGCQPCHPERQPAAPSGGGCMAAPGIVRG